MRADAMMGGRRRPAPVAVLGGCLLLLAAGSALAAGSSPAEVTFFEARIRPLLVQRCGGCHGEKQARGGLRLDHAAGLRRGGDHGPVVVPGRPEASRLIAAVRYAAPDLRMPPGGRLPLAEQELLAEWVRRGAPFPESAPAKPSAPAGATSPAALARWKNWWSFRPLAEMRPPAAAPGWALRRHDVLVLERLRRAGLRPSPEASPRTLIRRVCFDLTGLPPSPEHVEAFGREYDSERGLPPARRTAYARLVDRLLASPQYGERWARHWLDLVRYCDIPESWAQTTAQAWLYRDWVVRALNEDLPYDRFVRLQLAADELPGTPPADLAALGFLGLSPSYWKELKLAPDVIKTVVAEEWEERIHTVCSALLGLTVACARCHDHKFDPISTKEYYALAGVFASTRMVSRPLLPEAAARRVLAAREQAEALEAEAKRLQQTAAREPGRAAELQRQAAAARERAAAVREACPGYDAQTAYAVDTASLAVVPDGPDRTRLEYAAGTGQDVPLQRRGNPALSGPLEPRRFLAVLSQGSPPRFTRGSGRGELAEAIFREARPLAARVIVNRVWRHHFGRGLVETPSNFGAQGERPSHPELLDDLAARFVQAGWSLKWLHREILLSATYRQGTAASPRNQRVDPDNRLLGRSPRRRLEVEPWRDAILAAAGNLDLRPGGAPGELRAAHNLRRTLYGTVKRRELDDLLRLYDFPDPTTHSPARFPTTTPLQQLYVLNGELIGRQAAVLAARVRRELPEGAGAQVRRAYMLLYSRPPAPRELAAALRFLGAGSTGGDAWQELAEVLLARGELMFVD